MEPDCSECAIDEEKRENSIGCNEAIEVCVLEGDFWYSGAEVPSVLSVVTSRPCLAAIHAGYFVIDGVPGPGPFVIPHDSAVGGTEAVRQKQQFPLLVRTEPPAFLNSNASILRFHEIVH